MDDRGWKIEPELRSDDRPPDGWHSPECVRGCPDRRPAGRNGGACPNFSGRLVPRPIYSPFRCAGGPSGRASCLCHLAAVGPFVNRQSSTVIFTMTESTHGIILRTRPLTETSLIIHWLTPDLGRIATVAQGARRPKSPFAGKLDLFYAADFSFSRSRRSELHRLREACLRETHGPIREDILKLQQAGYAAAFLEQATETD